MIPLFAQDSISHNQPASGLNTKEYVEFAPTISADGRTMIFQSNRPDGNGYKLFESTLQPDGVWATPKPIDAINHHGRANDLIGGPSLTFDGNYLYFFASFDGGFGREDIYYSNRTSGGWSAPINVGEPINTPDYEGFPSISADGKTLYFVKEKSVKSIENKAVRRSLNIAYEIYASQLRKDGSWGKPRVLPPPINVFSSKAPRIMADNKTLIFSAIRSELKLDYDLFQSRKGILGNWSFPEPLRYVNTVSNDQFSCISAAGDKLYYIHNEEDIYSVSIPEPFRQFVNNVVTGTVMDEDSGEGVVANIEVTDALTSEVIMQATSAGDGHYAVVLAAGRSYNIMFNHEGFSSFMKPYDFRKVKKYQEFNENIQLFASTRVSINVSDNELFEPLEASVLVTDITRNKVLTEVKTSRLDGHIQLSLPLGSTYQFDVQKENFKPASFSMDYSGMVMFREFEKDVEMQPVKVKVFISVEDLKNNSRVRSKIRIRNKSRNELIEIDGNEFVSLRTGDRYEIEATSDQGYAFNSAVLDLTNSVNAGSGGTNVSMKLMKLEQNAKLTLKDINFETNSYQLSESSFIELQRVVKLMRENPKLKVEIAAHTDDIGSDNYNYSLSDDRAKSVVEYLIDNQIPFSRFIAKGYGEEQPLVPNDSDENRAKNRRVELKVLSVF